MSRYDSLLLNEEEAQPQEKQYPAPGTNWDTLLTRAGNHNLHPKIKNYLHTMYDAGVELSKNEQGYFFFLPGQGPGWDHNSEGELNPGAELAEILAIFYTHLVAIPAKVSNSPAWPAIKTAIEAGGYIGPGEKALRFHWDRAPGMQVERARGELDKVAGEVKKCLNWGTKEAAELGVSVTIN